jgi:hypothetical protein
MGRVSDPTWRFARFLAASEGGPVTIKNYRSEVGASAPCFDGRNGERMESPYITLTDTRWFKC